MAARVRAAAIVTLLVAFIGGLPGLTPRAVAGPRVVTVATYDIEPFVMTHGNAKTGFTVDVLTEIAKRLGWTLNYLEVASVEDQLKAVTGGKADAAAGALSITADRNQNYDFSQPIINSGLQIMVPASSDRRSSAGLVDFLKLLFSRAVLIWLTAALVLAVIPAHVVWLMERNQPDSQMSNKYMPGIFQAFAYGLGMLASQPDTFPRHWVNRGVGILLAFVSIIFVAYYTATLTANLTVDKFNAQISKPSDLVDKRVCTLDDTTSSQFLAQEGIAFSGVRKIGDCYTALKKNTADAVVFDAPVLSYYTTHEGAGRATLVGTVFENEDYGIAFPDGSDLRKRTNDALLEMRESGDYDIIKKKWFGSGS